MAERRLRRELLEISRDPPPGCSAAPIDDHDLLKWQGTIAGPVDSPYDGGVFLLQITFPENYPHNAPKVEFTTNIYHPNVEQYTGTIFSTIFSTDWYAGYTVSKLLLSITALLTSPQLDVILNREAADLYELDRKKYNETVAEWTRTYAM